MDGRCKTLDAIADGYGRTEDCIVMMLKKPNGDQLAQTPLSSYVLIEGTCVNQDGRSSSLTAPSGPAQQVTLRTAMSVGCIDKNAISTIELHGTGTPLGDPVEFGAVLDVFEVSNQ